MQNRAADADGRRCGHRHHRGRLVAIPGDESAEHRGQARNRYASRSTSILRLRYRRDETAADDFAGYDLGNVKRVPRQSWSPCAVKYSYRDDGVRRSVIPAASFRNKNPAWGNAGFLACGRGIALESDDCPMAHLASVRPLIDTALAARTRELVGETPLLSIEACTGPLGDNSYHS
jgi:hypothetical protein